ncbi:MAG: hypothetical protein GY702_14445, partial [Desulfobulbaceae bacterium]|nr:hypothetical protein [Desulfobulbaceae bacterium]
MQKIFLKQNVKEEKTKLGYFTSGLHHEVRLETERVSINTLDEAVEEARKVERIVTERRKMEEEREKRLTRGYENIINAITASNTSKANNANDQKTSTSKNSNSATGNQVATVAMQTHHQGNGYFNPGNPQLTYYPNMAVTPPQPYPQIQTIQPPTFMQQPPQMPAPSYVAPAQNYV